MDKARIAELNRRLVRPRHRRQAISRPLGMLSEPPSSRIRRRLFDGGGIEGVVAVIRRGAGSGKPCVVYRVNRLARAGGTIIKRMNILAASDRQAVKTAEQDLDCPVCDVLRDGEKVGEVT